MLHRIKHKNASSAKWNWRRTNESVDTLCCFLRRLQAEIGTKGNSKNRRWGWNEIPAGYRLACNIIKVNIFGNFRLQNGHEVYEEFHFLHHVPRRFRCVWSTAIHVHIAPAYVHVDCISCQCGLANSFGLVSFFFLPCSLILKIIYHTRKTTCGVGLRMREFKMSQCFYSKMLSNVKPTVLCC